MNPKINSYSLEDLAKHHEQTQSVVHRYVTEADMLDDRKEFVKKEFEYLKEIERLEIELKKRDEQNAALAATVEALREAWEAVKRNDWDAPLDEAFEKTPQQHLRQVLADAGYRGWMECARIYCTDEHFTPHPATGMTAIKGGASV